MTLCSRWAECLIGSLESAFAPLYSDLGRSGKLIRLMCGLLMLKQLHNLSDESVVDQDHQPPKQAG